MGITKVRTGREGSVILGCETEEELVKLKDTVQSKVDENYNGAESLQKKPIKITNISEEEMELDGDELISTSNQETEQYGWILYKYSKENLEKEE